MRPGCSQSIKLLSAAAACLLTVAALSIAVIPSADAAPTGITSTLVNFDASGGTSLFNQVARFDTDGGNIDAEEGQISEFVDPATNSTIFVLYGESHACGFDWSTPGTPFCGFNAYTSTDLVHWAKRGKLFDPTGVLGANANTAVGHTPQTTWQSLCNSSQYGCFRPHVLYNTASKKFVLWFYATKQAQFYVMTSSSPYSGFTLAKDAVTLGPSSVQGDENLFVDPTSTSNPPAAYITHAYYETGTPATLDVQRLNDDYTGVTSDGPHPTWVQASTLSSSGDYGVEAPAMFERTVGSTPVYFLTYSDPHCAYGTDCGTSYVWSLSPTGPWGPGPVTIGNAPPQPTAFHAGTSLNVNSCGGQPTAVTPYTQADGTTGYLFQSDLNRWVGSGNQGVSNFYWTPLSFDAAGSPQPFTCTATSTVTLKYGVSSADPVPPNVDATDVASRFQADSCSIHGSTDGYTQVVTAGRAGSLTSVSVTVFMASPPDIPDAPLKVAVVAMNGTGVAARPSGATPYATASFQPAQRAPGSPADGQVGWSMRTLTVPVPNVPVQVGTVFGIQLTSALTKGCYGAAVNPIATTNPYPQGVLLVPSGSSWAPLSNSVDGTGRSLRFTTQISANTNTNLAAGRPVQARSSVEYAGWSSQYLTDGATTSTGAVAGYHSDVSNQNPLQPEYTIVDLGAAHVVNKFVLYPAHPVGYPAGFGYPVRFQLRVSNDPTFATYSVLVDAAAADVPNPGDAVQTFDVSNRSTADRTGRYAQLYVAKLPQVHPGSYSAAMAELQVYGS